MLIRVVLNLNLERVNLCFCWNQPQKEEWDERAGEADQDQLPIVREILCCHANEPVIDLRADPAADGRPEVRHTGKKRERRRFDMFRCDLGEDHGHRQENEALGDDLIDDVKEDDEEHIRDSQLKVVSANEYECQGSEENTDQSIDEDELAVFSVSEVSIVHECSKE